MKAGRQERVGGVWGIPPHEDKEGPEERAERLQREKDIRETDASFGRAEASKSAGRFRQHRAALNHRTGESIAARAEEPF